MNRKAFYGLALMAAMLLVAVSASSVPAMEDEPFTVKATLKSSAFHYYSPVEVAITISSDKKAWLDLGLDSSEAITFSVREEGQKVGTVAEWPLNDGMMDALVPIVPDKPMEINVVLNDWYTLKPGMEYSVEVRLNDPATGNIVGSDIFKLEMVPDREGGLASAISRPPTEDTGAPTTEQDETRAFRTFCGIAFCGDKSVVPYLRKVLLNDNADPKYRKRAVVGLARVKGIDGIKALAEILMDDPGSDPTVTGLMVKQLLAVRKTGTAEAVAALEPASAFLDEQEKIFRDGKKAVPQR